MVQTAPNDTTTAGFAPRPLAEQAVLVLGGTGGIGLETARRFAAAGARTAIAGRDAARGNAAAATLAAEGHAHPPGFLQADAADPAAVAALFESAEARLGRLDTLVISTGGNRLPELLHRQSLDDIRSALLLDLAPVLYAGRAAVEPMRRAGGGAVIAVASDAGKLATPGEAVIGAGMAAIIQFMRTLAIEEKRHGIRANTLTPSLVEGTPLTERLMAEGTFSAKLFAKARPLAALGPTQASDLAELALFLASPAARRITGQAISANGGISAA
ncbi:MAG: SDR family oxidoreductase [Pseudomonadota bacterium]